MKKLGKIAALFVAVALAFGFVSCKNDADESDTPAPQSVTLSSIAVSGTPATALYYVGGSIGTMALTVTATYSDGSSKTVTGWTSDFSTSEVSLGKTVTISYTEGGVTKTATVSGTFYVAAAEAKPTESPVLLSGYTGTLADGTYYKFGDFPQTISALTGENAYTAEPVYNGWYLGSDGYFYAKCIENAYKDNYTYTDGTTAAQSSANSEKYFKVEPIVWRAVTESFDHDADGNGDKILLVAESILMANVPYYGTFFKRTLSGLSIFPNNYMYSNIRAYLNGKPNQFVTDGGTATSYDIDWSGKGFIDTAFTQEAQGKILVTKVDNSAESTNPDANASEWNSGINDYACDITEDKVFLLSAREATTEDYGFTAYRVYGKGNSRIRITTDYAKANYADQSDTAGWGGCWWLRSPGSSADYNVRGISNSGAAYVSYTLNNMYLGVVPALSISKGN